MKIQFVEEVYVRFPVAFENGRALTGWIGQIYAGSEIPHRESLFGRGRRLRHQYSWSLRNTPQTYQINGRGAGRFIDAGGCVSDEDGMLTHREDSEAERGYEPCQEGDYFAQIHLPTERPGRAPSSARHRYRCGIT